MHLKAVRLFFRARLCIDAADIRFRIGIGSSSHERLPNNYVKQRENQRVAALSLESGFFWRRQIPCLPFLFVLIGGQKDVARVPCSAHPHDHFNEVRFSHRRATGGGPVHPATNMEENRASRPRHRRVGIVPDLD